MKELDLQDKYLIHFLCERRDGLQYREVKPNTVSPQFFIVEDVRHFISQTALNKANYSKLLKKFDSEKALMQDFMRFLNEKIKESKNTALFFNRNKAVTFKGLKLHLFYPSGSQTKGDALFDQNLFSVVQELPYTYKYEERTRFSFRPDVSFFLNGIYLGYHELKSPLNRQDARHHGRQKVISDYQRAVAAYADIAEHNDVSESIRRDMLKPFEKAIHITATDISETYIIRNLAGHFDEARKAAQPEQTDTDTLRKEIENTFKPYPVRNREASRRAQFEEVFRALYDKRMIEKEILYYNFIERELVRKEGSKQKEYKHRDGKLISPRPKQKFGTDKILAKVDELLAHESEPDYFINKLRAELEAKGLGEAQIQELVEKRQKYQNNKHVYSLLLQYAAGFGKSNIIGWTALQLKDLKNSKGFVYDKIMLVVDRLQLRDQLDTKMHNMNINKTMFVEADSQKTFKKALEGDTRIVVVNLQKFGAVKDFLSAEMVQQLAGLRIAFLIDEIHRSNRGVQHESMVSLFDELQASFDNNEAYKQQRKKKNLVIGFTATPSDHTLARFGEYNKYAEAEKIWVPFDSYTMSEAIKDGYILNPIDGVVPVSAKMYFELPENQLKGFEGDTGYEDIPDGADTGVDGDGKKYRIRKRLIYENPDRIEAVAQFVTERLVTSVYPRIGGYAKAMLAVTSIKAAIAYKKHIDRYYAEITQQSKYEKYKEAPICIVYTGDGQQGHPKPSTLNEGMTEKKVLQHFSVEKNGLMIVVDKLQTGFDEPKLHTLFLDKEVSGIGAIQTISRVNRKTKNKHDCKIVDFSYKNVNVNNIKQAFAHFSNVVVSDFDPLKDEEKLEVYHSQLTDHLLAERFFDRYVQYASGQGDFSLMLDMDDGFAEYIRKQPREAKALKKDLNAYFKILNRVEYVIELDPKFSEKHFVDFWRLYNNMYNHLVRPGDLVDDVEVYFDNRIGITAPAEEKEPKPTVKGGSREGEGTQYKFDILKVIAKRNQEEEEIGALIKDFETKIEQFFTYIHQDDAGKRVIAKMKAGTSAFETDEIQEDFARLYRKFTRRNKKTLGEFFVKETKDIINQLCDDFEKTLKISRLYPDATLETSLAAEKETYREYEMVVAAQPIGEVPQGTQGAIVMVHAGYNAYEVEFILDGASHVKTVEYSQIEKLGS